VLAAHEPEADRLAALNRTFGGWLALIEEAGRSVASSAFAGTFHCGACWRPDDSVVKSVVTDPSGWFTVEWAALVSAVGQAYSVESDQLGWALGVRLARIFLARGYYDDWRGVCELMLAGARQAVNAGREGMALRRLGELPRLTRRLDEALEGFDQTLTACGAPGGHPGRSLATSSSGHKSGCFDEVVARLEDTLAYLRELADRHGEASPMHRLGTVHRLQRCHEKAVRCFQQVLDALDVFSDPLRGVALVSSGVPPEVSSGPARGIRLAAVHGTPDTGW
jgi:hypothetical protein